MKNNLWNGKIIDLKEAQSLLNKIEKDDLIHPPLDIQIVYKALSNMSLLIQKKDHFFNELVDGLKSNSENPILDIEELLGFIKIDHLRSKIRQELADENPFELKRINGRSDAFEAYYPLGTILHITPNNSSILSVCAVIEGLITGNLNILKLGRKEGAFSVLFFEKLCDLDFSGELKKYLYILQISSKDSDLIKKMMSLADGISVWGNEESVKSVKEEAPLDSKIIEWGHKISFSYFTEKYRPYDLNKLATEICFNNQLFCSSPQCVYLENASFNDLKEFAKKLSDSLKLEVKKHPKVALSQEEHAEITVTREVLNLRSIEEECAVVSGEGFRIYIDNNAALKASPLYKTIWLKSIKRENIVKQFKGISRYLQTVGISCAQDEYEDLVGKLILAGALRIRNIGYMLESYGGEPHDGIYALLEFTKKINVLDSSKIYMKEKYSFEKEKHKTSSQYEKIMTKADFQSQKIESQYSDLFFHSGGSSGEPKLSVFTYADYNRQMEVAAEGLYAAGLEPDKDRTMNLFYAGNLYGGFTSFFTILNHLNAVQFPMGASTDFEMVGKTIVENKVDTLLGMPSYILELFRKNSDFFKKHKTVKKIFFGGEHFSKAQKDYLIKEFGLDYIRSASYGSVDAGPLAFQCAKSDGNSYHLYEKLHDLEFVSLEEDVPVKEGELGRLLFTSLVRHGQEIKRYEIGDVGKKLLGTCACGRKGVRFELLGRHGDIFRIGTIFLSYQKFQKILIDLFDFSGQFQLHLYAGSKDQFEKLEMKISGLNEKSDDIFNKVVAAYPDLYLVLNTDKVLTFNVSTLEKEELDFNNKTGKLKSVVDHRN